MKDEILENEEGELAKTFHREYDLITSVGMISIENIPDKKCFQGGLGIQISPNGKVWICIDGVAFLRFNPYTPKYLKRGNGRDAPTSHDNKEEI